MLKNKTKESLIEEMSDKMDRVLNNRDVIVEIKDHLATYGITGGYIEGVFSEPEVLNEADDREVVLFAEQMYWKTGLEELNPEKWFTKNEIKTAHQYDKRVFSDSPKTSGKSKVIFKNSAIVGNGVYVTTIDLETITELMDAQELHYNFDLQRQPRKRKGSIVPVATVYKKNVKEIKDLLLKEQLVTTTLAFNAAAGSSDTGEELTFDSSTGDLIINEGTKLDILDGYHRCLASVQAYKQNPNLKFRFMLMISNYTTRQAQQYQAQLAKATPIPKTRIQELEADRLADAVVQELKSDSELTDRVSSHQNPNRHAGEWVSYSVLSDAIDREFQMNVRRDTINVANYLRKFFDYLVGDYQEVFLDNSSTEKSLMNYNKMYAGYIALAARMYKEDVSLDKLKSILDTIDFSRTNDEWTKLGIVNSEGKITERVDDKKIGNYFRKINIS